MQEEPPSADGADCPEVSQKLPIVRGAQGGPSPQAAVLQRSRWGELAAEVLGERVEALRRTPGSPIGLRSVSGKM